ncbi:MAG: Xaa-Pro dipeptidase [Acidobacteriota bacterium]
MTSTDLYRDHLAALDRWLADSLERAGRRGVSLDGVLFHAGRERTYHADDNAIAFWSTPHFRRWCPIAGPEHIVLARPGGRVQVVRVRPMDFWFDTSMPPASYWESVVDLSEAESFEKAAESLGSLERIAYVGDAPEAAQAVGIDADRIEPAELMAPLDWYRAYKTPWEVALTEVAVRRAASGHLAGLEMFRAGATEREIHWAFLEGSDQIEREVPFNTIVALEEKGAVLHYERKRGPEAAPGRTLLLDAGASFEGYASDLTRTWVGEGADPVFKELVEGVDALEQELVAMVAPGVPYPDIHQAAHRGVAQILQRTGVVKVSADEAMERGLTRHFFPHGVGHHLGIQVHDVGGHQAGPDGGEVAPPAEYPLLRTTRPLEAGHLVTIEPGIYFNPVLLDPVRGSDDASAIDWAVVDCLRPFGGVRIEDDVLCTENGARDLSREHLPGPRE